MNEILNWFNSLNFDLVDLCDVAFVWLLIYGLLVWIKRTRAAFILTGIIITAVIYFLAGEFNLVLTTTMFRGFFAVILIALVIIFQEELRHFFESVAVWGFTHHKKRKILYLERPEIECLVRALSDFAREKIGAIIVLQGRDMILGYLDGGIDLDGKLSEPLLKSIFDPASEGHDGALIVNRDRVTQFAAHLPLSKNLSGLQHTGTRHAAALGLSERSDALCLVVSEERGTISAARYGKMKVVHKPDALDDVIEKFYEEIDPRREKRSILNLVRKNFKEKAAALFIACLLWFVHVYGNELIYKSYQMPISLPKPPAPFVVTVEPYQVNVTFLGPRKAFYFKDHEVRYSLKNFEMREGGQLVRASSNEISCPSILTIKQIDPAFIKIQISKTEEKDSLARKEKTK